MFRIKKPFSIENGFLFSEEKGYGAGKWEYSCITEDTPACAPTDTRGRVSMSVNENLSYKHTAASSSLSRWCEATEGCNPPVSPLQRGDFVQYVIQVNFRFCLLLFRKEPPLSEFDRGGFALLFFG